MKSDLNEIAAQIDSWVEDETSKVGIGIETGPDEAFFIATRDGLLRLAAALVRSVAKPSRYETELQAGLAVQWNTETQGVFEETSEISISAECFVVKPMNVRDAVLHFQRISPEASDDER